MRSVIAFDTWQFIKELKDSGMEQSEAEAISKALISALAQLMETKEIATKQDIAEVRQDLHNAKTELQQQIVHSYTENKEYSYDIKAELKQDIHEVKQNITSIQSDITQEIRQSELRTTTAIYQLKDDIKTQELKLKSFFVRCLTTMVMLLGGLEVIIKLCTR